MSGEAEHREEVLVNNIVWIPIHLLGCFHLSATNDKDLRHSYYNSWRKAAIFYCVYILYNAKRENDLFLNMYTLKNPYSGQYLHVILFLFCGLFFFFLTLAGNNKLWVQGFFPCTTHDSISSSRVSFSVLYVPPFLSQKVHKLSFWGRGK